MDTISVALQRLTSQGARLLVGRAETPKAVPVDVFEAAATAQKQPCVIELPPRPAGADAVRLPVRGADDLAVLSVLYASGAPAVASNPHLAGALRTLMNASAKFTSEKVDVGAYGAWVAATSGSTDLTASVNGSSSPIESADEVAAFAFFNAGGSADDLSLPHTAKALQALHDAHVEFATRDWGDETPTRTYGQLASGDAATVTVKRGGGTLSRAELESDPDCAKRAIERAHRYDRFEAVRGDSYGLEDCVEAVEAPVGQRPLPEREAAMTELLRLPRDYRNREVAQYQAVVAAARDGETLDATARDFVHVMQACDGVDSDEAMKAWTTYRKLDANRDGFLELVKATRDGEVASRAFACVYGDGDTSRFADRRSTLDTLQGLEAGQHRRRHYGSDAWTKAVETFETYAHPLLAGETEAQALHHAVELASAVPHDAVCGMRRLLPLSAPASLSIVEKEARFTPLLPHGEFAEIAPVWQQLVQGRSTEQLDEHLAALHNMLSQGRPLDEAMSDLQKLDQSGVDAARLQRLLQVSDSLDGAREAAQRLSKVAQPADVDVREKMYVLLAAPHRGTKGSQLDEAMDDYWYVVRSAGSGDVLQTAQEFASCLQAVDGDSVEARVAHTMARTRLQDGGPLHVDAARRSAWLADALGATGHAEQAWTMLGFIESASTIAGAEDRAASMHGLLSVARRFDSPDDAADAIALYGEMSAGGPVATAADPLADIAGRLSNSGNRDGLPRLCAALIHPSGDLARELADFAPLLDVAPNEWDAVDAWPAVRDTRPDLSNADKVAALARVAEGSHAYDLQLGNLIAVLAEGARDGDGLRHNAETLRRFAGESARLREGVATYAAVRHAASEFGDAEARVARYADAAGRGVSTEGIGQFLQAVRTPFGGDDASQREDALFALFALESELGASSAGIGTTGAGEAALHDLQTVGRRLLPGDRLSAVSDLFVGLAHALRGTEKARDVMDRLMESRLEGQFIGMSLPDLMQSFCENYAVDGNIDRALDAMRKRAPHGGAPPTIENGADDITVGGVRVPKKK